MDFFLLTMILVVITLILVGILLGVLLRSKRRKGEPLETDYRVMFYLGVILMPAGFFLAVISRLFFGVDTFYAGLPILTIGIIYFLVGYENRDKWKREQM